MVRTTLAAAALAAAIGIGVPVAAIELGGFEDPVVDRDGRVADLLTVWRESAADAGFDLDAWDSQWRRIFGAASRDQLEAAEAASSMDALREAFGLGPLADKVLGDANRDLVFTPIRPCRLLATDAATGSFAGRLSPGVRRDFSASGSLAAQGGNPYGCWVPDDAVSLVAKLSTWTPLDWGMLTAWSYLATQPDPVLAYDANYYTRASTTTVIELCRGCGYQFSVVASGPGATHVRAEVVGYMRRPEATPLSCTTVHADLFVAPAQPLASLRASCPSGTTLTGGGIAVPSILQVLVSAPDFYSGASLRTYRCDVRNTSGSAAIADCFATCCKVPGR